VWSPDGGRCLAEATVRALHDRAAHHGADVRFATGPAAVEVLPAGDRVRVRIEGDSWTASVAVVTAGSWLPRLLGPLVALPALKVTEEQWQHFATVDPEAAERWPSFIHHRAPWIYGLYTPGEGVKVARHHVGPEVDPDRRAATPDPAAGAVVADYVREWLPGLDPEPVHAATCLYTTTPTEDFILDRVGPLVIGSPCSGHGFKFTPVIGRILADLADGLPGPGGRFRLP
jgi:sarcosine oxidase